MVAWGGGVKGRAPSRHLDAVRTPSNGLRHIFPTSFDVSPCAVLWTVPSNGRLARAKMFDVTLPYMVGAGNLTISVTAVIIASLRSSALAVSR